MYPLIFSTLLTAERRRKPSLIEEGKCTPLFRSQPVPFRVLNQSLLHLISIATTFCHGGNPGDQEMEAFFPTTAYLSLTYWEKMLLCRRPPIVVSREYLKRCVIGLRLHPKMGFITMYLRKYLPFDLSHFLQLPCEIVLLMRLMISILEIPTVGKHGEKFCVKRLTLPNLRPTISGKRAIECKCSQCTMFHFSFKF